MKTARSKYTLYTLFILLMLCIVSAANAQEITPTPAPVVDSVSPALQLALEPLFTEIFRVIAVALGGLAVWLFKRLLNYLKVRLNTAQLLFVKMLFTEAVRAAEQLGAAAVIADTAQAKKLYATKAVTEQLAKHGLYTLANNSKYISDGIESAVMEQFNQAGSAILAEWENIAEPLKPLQPQS